MYFHKPHFPLLLAAAAFLILNIGCAVHASGGYYRAYDPVHHDYHAWDNNENTYYNQWVNENHRDRREYRKLKKSDQQKYWDWRHDHPDHH